MCTFLIPTYGKIAVPICLLIFPLTPSIVRPLFHFFSIPHNTILGQTTFSSVKKNLYLFLYIYSFPTPRNAISFFISQPYLYYIPILYYIILGYNKEILCYVCKRCPHVQALPEAYLCDIKCANRVN